VKFGRIRTLVIAAAWTALVAGPVLAASSSVSAVPVAPAASCDWATFGHDAGRSFAAPDTCTTVNALSVHTLLPRWHVNTSSPVTAQPAVVGGTVYVGTAGGTFYAVDGASGAVKWTYQVGDGSTNDYGKIVSSAAVATVDGKRVVMFGGGATLYVLDASDGPVPNRLLAAACVDPNRTRNPDSTKPCGPTSNTTEIESSPVVIPFGKGATRVLVGMDFNETSNVGEAGLLAFNLQGGKGGWHLTPLWKYDPETRQTYTSDPIYFGGSSSGHACGDVWSSAAVTGNVAVFGVGNCDFANIGTPPVTESVAAVAVDSGALLWSYQPRDPVPASQLDLDFGATPNVLPNGNVGEGGKDGVYYSFKPAQSSVLSPTPSWTSHVATASNIGGMIGSTAVGKANGKPAIFASTAIPFHTGQPDVSFQENLQNPGHAMGLHAIDAATGQKLWDAPAAPAYGAAIYSNGVVFVPDTFSFSMQAYDANTGVPLWAFPLGEAPASPPAVVANSIYFGSGVTEAGLPALGSIGGIWGFSTTP
jgi:polyvinyl alcohol dehydrogenase (cytochrome)